MKSPDFITAMPKINTGFFFYASNVNTDKKPQIGKRRPTTSRYNNIMNSLELHYFLKKIPLGIFLF